MRWQWAGLIPLAVLAAVAEAFGAAAIFGFLQVIADPSRVEMLPIVSSVYQRLLPLEDRLAIVVFGLLLMLFYLARNGVLSVVAYLHEGLVQKSIVDVSRRLFRGYLNVPYAFHLDRNSATLIQQVRMSVDAAFERVLASAIGIASEVLIALALIAILATAAPLVTVVAAALTLLLLLLPNLLTKRFFTRSGEQRKRLEEELLQGLQQSLGALKEIKLAGRERFFHGWVTERRQALGRVLHHRSALSASLRLAVETAFLCVMLLVVLLVTLTLGPGADVVSLLGLFAYATFRLVPSANRITLYLSSARAGHAFVPHLYDDFVTTVSQPDPAGSTPVDGPITFADAIVFDRVSYVYQERREHAVWEMDLTIRRGESVGIVGRTGAGKSTLADLLLGLLHPTSGRIRVDGRDIRTGLRAWQSLIGYVPQEFFLIDDTLRRNIAFGLDEHEIDEGKVINAARLAQLDELVASLPQGLETRVGERGVRLSGGQRQRVTIARALYREPQVLVFDEATAALDTPSEQEIVRAIEALHGTKTMIVIAHRLTTVHRCDRIVFMDAGRVTGVRSFQQLLEGHAGFREMAGVALTPQPVVRS